MDPPYFLAIIGSQAGVIDTNYRKYKGILAVSWSIFTPPKIKKGRNMEVQDVYIKWFNSTRSHHTIKAYRGRVKKYGAKTPENLWWPWASNAPRYQKAVLWAYDCWWFESEEHTRIFSTIQAICRAFQLIWSLSKANKYW